MTKYEPVVTKDKDIETAVSHADQTPVANKVEDVTHVVHGCPHKRPFLKGMFVGVVGTLLLSKLHMVIRHRHYHHHGNHGDHPTLQDTDSNDAPEDVPEYQMWQKEKSCEKAHNKEMCEEWYDKMMKDGEKKWQKEKRCESAHNKKMCEEWYDKEMKNEEEMWLKEKRCEAAHGKKVCKEWYEKAMKERDEQQEMMHKQHMMDTGVKAEYPMKHVDEPTNSSEENSSDQTSESADYDDDTEEPEVKIVYGEVHTTEEQSEDPEGAAETIQVQALKKTEPEQAEVLRKEESP